MDSISSKQPRSDASWLFTAKHFSSIGAYGHIRG
jgi:hypothetical protein